MSYNMAKGGDSALYLSIIFAAFYGEDQTILDHRHFLRNYMLSYVDRA